MNVKAVISALFTLPLLTQLCAADKLPAFDKTKFWYKSPRITLYNRRSRGASFNSVMTRARYKVQNPRPAKVQSLFTKPNSTATALLIMPKSRSNCSKNTELTAKCR